jgi:DNA-directed RNA polymerase sigma subunit (sigma70/sigma32)
VVRDRKLLRAARRGNLRAREKVVVSRLGMIRAVAERYGGLGVPYEDLVQEGSLGLLDAIERYDPGRGRAVTGLSAPAVLEARAAGTPPISLDAPLS